MIDLQEFLIACANLKGRKYRYYHHELFKHGRPPKMRKAR